MEIVVEAENPTGTICKYYIDCLFPVPTHSHLSVDMRGEL